MVVMDVVQAKVCYEAMEVWNSQEVKMSGEVIEDHGMNVDHIVTDIAVVPLHPPPPTHPPLLLAAWVCS